MIWYLLYLFRGTTEAPVLDPNHPLRVAFTRFGRYAARHVVTTLLISVTVATILLYPIPFLFTNDFANGASNLPHHVWTAAQPLDYASSVEPDVIMRSIWVHGNYMGVLDRDVLLGALELQDELLGRTENFDPRYITAGTVGLDDESQDLFPDPASEIYSLIRDIKSAADLDPPTRDRLHIINGLTDASWFFHSPLQYWACSPENIETDPDLVATVNHRKSQSTSVNITLRHSIVFSGKRFADRRLLAADALVITLIHLRDSPVAKRWMSRAQSLPSSIADKWDVYPPDGHSASSQLYEFQFKPISLQDSLLLALAYGLTLFYCLVSLSKIRAVKSKIGLSITMMTQIVVSIMSSFTVCAILDVDLSRIPRAGYPLIVLALSLENIFRLINAVILTPAEDSTCNRIGHAFGETAHIGLASSIQNIGIFWCLSYVVSPGVSAFCIFAILVIIFDFFYLSTFFLSVLSVDVRRTELSDSLAKASLKQSRNRGGSIAPQSWTEAMLQGKIALSTRISGTIVTVAFVLIAQWHFYGEGIVSGFLARLLGTSHDGVSNNIVQPWPLGEIHQARSPTSWLRLQDHETAREVIHVVKPSAHSYIARVYEPLVFVLKGADRMPKASEGFLPPAAYDFIHHQLAPFVAVIVFALAAVYLLTNYLLWEAQAESETDAKSAGGGHLGVRPLEQGHDLDVIKMIASGDGHLVSIGLDRRIHVWDTRLGISIYEITALGSLVDDFLPVLSMAIDDESRWLALLSPTSLLVWNLADRRWTATLPVDLYGQKPEAFFFMPSHDQPIPSLVLVQRNGIMTQFWPASMEQNEMTISGCPLKCAIVLSHKSAHARAASSIIVTASRDRYIQITTYSGSQWSTHSISLDSGPDDGGGEVHQLVGIQSLDVVLVARRDSVLVLDLRNSRVAHTLLTEQIQPRSVKVSCTRRHMSQPGPPGLTSLTLAYANADTGDLVTQSYVGLEDGGKDMLQLRDGAGFSNGPQIVWLESVQTNKHIHCPGAWELLPSGHMLGVRHKLKNPPNGAFKHTHGDYSGLRHRKCMRGTLRRGQSGILSWEVWLSQPAGKPEELEMQPLLKDEEAAKHLLISQMGPLARVGRNSIAVGFGNTIHVVTAGQERGPSHFADFGDSGEDDGFLQLGNRRRRPGVGRARPPMQEVPLSAAELGVFKYLSL
jgi:hypothetical protein